MVCEIGQIHECEVKCSVSCIEIEDLEKRESRIN